jgi:hypothetical protein
MFNERVLKNDSPERQMLEKTMEDVGEDKKTG